MTISSTTNRKEYTGDDATVAFSTSPVVFFDEGDLDVYVVVTATGVATLKTITTHYAVSGGDGSTGTVTMLTAPASTETLVIVRNLDATQATDFVNNDTSDAEVLEDALDKLTILTQQANARLDRCFVLADSDISGASTEIPTPVADGVIKWNAAGDELEAVEFSGLLPDDVTVSAFGATLVDDATAAAARATLGFPDIAAKGDLIVGSADDTLVKLAVGTDGYGLQALAAATSGLAYVPPPVGHSLINGYLDWSVSGNALTVAIKTLAGTDPSTTDPVYVWIRNATATTGSPTLAKITAAMSVVVPSGGELGAIANTAFRVWAVVFDDGGTYRLGVINCRIGTAPNVAVYPLAGWGVASSTTVGTGSDSAGVFYTSTGVTAKGYAVAGYATWESGLATPGTWGTAPTREHPFTAGTCLPGSVVQLVREQTGAVATGTTTTPGDDSQPLAAEGNEYMDVSITPSSAANLIRVSSQFNGGHSATTGTPMVMFLTKDAGDALAVAISSRPSASADAQQVSMVVSTVDLAGSTSAITYNVRGGGNVAGTTTFNGAASVRLYGGFFGSFVEAEEVMT